MYHIVIMSKFVLGEFILGGSVFWIVRLILVQIVSAYFFSRSFIESVILATVERCKMVLLRIKTILQRPGKLFLQKWIHINHVIRDRLKGSIKQLKDKILKIVTPEVLHLVNKIHQITQSLKIYSYHSEAYVKDKNNNVKNSNWTPKFSNSIRTVPIENNDIKVSFDIIFLYTNIQIINTLNKIKIMLITRKNILGKLLYL